MLVRSNIKSPFDGLTISILAAEPECSPKAVVQIAHGICGKKERFKEFMNYLSENGYACVANDHRGHGESIIYNKDRGYSYRGRSAAMIADMEGVTSWIEDRFPDTPIFLLGHSMGSLAVRTYIRKHDEKISGLIVCSSPSYDPLTIIGYILAKALCLINKGRIRPARIQENTSSKYNRRFKDEGDKAWTCSDPAVRETVSKDPACNFVLTADYSLTLMELMMKTYSGRKWHCHNSSMPILFLSGEDDPCLIDRKHFLHAVDHIRSVGYANVGYHLYPGMRHEVLHEKEKQKVWNEILKFIS